MKHLAPTSLQHFVSEQSSAASEHCPGVVDAEVVEVDPEVDEVVASLAQVSARLSGGAGCSRLVTTWFGWSENQKTHLKSLFIF